MQELAQSLAQRGILQIPPAFVRPPHDRPTIAPHAPSIPVIDLSLPNQQRLAQEIGRACSRYGFFQVLNHGIPQEVLERVIRLGASFFALPPHDKAAFACKDGVPASEGYGHKMLVQDDQVLDWRDYFDHHTLPLSRRNTENWPSHSPSYRKTIEEYSEQMKVLAQRLLLLISESLGLRPTYIQEVIGEPYQNISLNFYPPCPQPELTLGLQSHSDLGAITLLLQDEVGGLQVRVDGDWIPVQPIPCALVVNLADQIEIISNGRYRSVEHRAVVNRDKARISVATFYDPSRENVISPASELVDRDGAPRYNSVKFGDHVSAWYYKGPKGKKTLNTLAIA